MSGVVWGGLCSNWRVDEWWWLTRAVVAFKWSQPPGAIVGVYTAGRYCWGLYRRVLLLGFIPMQKRGAEGCRCDVGRYVGALEGPELGCPPGLGWLAFAGQHSMEHLMRCCAGTRCSGTTSVTSTI